MKKELLDELSIDFASPVPVYEQIKRIFKYAIARETMVQEEQMPSIRELASFLKINPNTVARAYRELSQEGVIGGRAGKGFWVAKSQHIQEDKAKMLKDEFLRFLERAVSMGFSHQMIKSMIDDFFREAQ